VKVPDGPLAKQLVGEAMAVTWLAKISLATLPESIMKTRFAKRDTPPESTANHLLTNRETAPESMTMVRAVIV
jgi:hypothetical protein